MTQNLQTTLQLYSDGGRFFTQFLSPAGLTGNNVFTWPTTAGSNGQVLITDGNGTLSFAAVSATDLAPDITISTTGNISTTGSGTITSAGLLSGQSGANITGGDITLGASGATKRSLVLWSGNTHKLTVTPATSMAADVTLTLPTGAGSSGQTVTSDGAGVLTFGTLPVAGGGTGLTSGTSGGVPTFTASGTIASSAALGAGAVVVGGGAGAVVTTLAGTSGGVVYFSASNVAASSGALAQYGVVLGGGAGAAPATLAADSSTTKVLTSGGSSANPSWAAVTASSFGTQTANTVLAGPTSGGAATPTYRALVGAESGMVLIATATAASSATVDFTSISNSSYSSYVIVGDNITPGTNGVFLILRFSVGGTFKTTDYASSVVRNTMAGIVTVCEGTEFAGGATAISLVAASDTLANSGANKGMFFTMHISNCAQVNSNKRVSFAGNYFGSATLNITGSGAYSPASDAVDGFRFLMNSGNIATGSFYLYGMRNA